MDYSKSQEKGGCFTPLSVMNTDKETTMQGSLPQCETTITGP